MFNVIDKSISGFNLKIVKSSILTGLEYFFSTRIGGDTPEPLNSFSISAKDYPQYNNFAIKNQKIACEILGGEYKNLIMPNQQHTDKIALIKSKEDIKILQDGPFDGIITNLKNFPVCLVFADCVPVLLFDETKQVLGCIHAGWKGTAKSIAAKAVKIMQKDFLCNPNKIKAIIGPAICQDCFEVNTDVARQLAISLKNNYDNIFIERTGKIHANLKAINKNQLKESGIQDIDVCTFCTSCDNNIFYSYRADNKCTGRHGLLAMIKE